METDNAFLNRFIETYVNSNRKKLTIAGIITLLIGVGILSLFTIDGLPKKTSDTIGGFSVVFIFLALGLLLLILSFRSKVEKNEVYKSINGDTTEVVWIYDSAINRNGTMFYQVSLGMKSGKTINFFVRDQEQQVLVRNRFRNICKNAKTGYSTERELAFKKNPTNFE